MILKCKIKQLNEDQHTLTIKGTGSLLECCNIYLVHRTETIKREMRFYDVETVQDLLEAQCKHILRLQGRTPHYGRKS